MQYADYEYGFDTIIYKDSSGVMKRWENELHDGKNRLGGSRSGRNPSIAGTRKSSSTSSLTFDRGTGSHSSNRYSSAPPGRASSLHGGVSSPTSSSPRNAPFSGDVKGNDHTGTLDPHTTRRPQTIHGQRISRMKTILDKDDPRVLREEIRGLQHALMNQLQGTHRFVGGSQFKASVRPKDGTCGECMQVRESLRRSRAECRNLRASVYRSEVAMKQLTLARNFFPRQIGSRKDDVEQRNTKVTEATKAGEEIEFSCDVLAQRVSHLERETNSLNLHRSKSLGDSESSEASLQKAHLELETVLANYRAMEQELLELSNGGCKTCENLKEQLDRERQRANEEEKKQIIHLRKLGTMQGVTASLEQAKARIDEEVQKAGGLLAKVDEQTRITKEWEHKANARDQELKFALDELLRCRSEVLTQKDKIEKNANQDDVANQEMRKMRERCQEMEAALEATKAQLREERELGEKRESAHDAELQAEKGIAKGLAEALESEGEARMEIEERAKRANESQKDALKAALNNSVRLCVVAPTVNINLDDHTRSFCSGLPEQKIRAFVERSVLPRFTRVLLQPGDEGSGKGKVSFDAWLRELLIDLQTSIETHIAKVFETQPATGGIARTRSFRVDAETDAHN